MGASPSHLLQPGNYPFCGVNAIRDVAYVLVVFVVIEAHPFSGVAVQPGSVSIGLRRLFVQQLPKDGADMVMALTLSVGYAERVKNWAIGAKPVQPVAGNDKRQ